MSEIEEKTDKEKGKRVKNNSTSYSLFHSRLRGHTALYLKIPIYFSLLFIPVILWAWYEGRQVFISVCVCFAMYLILTISLYFYEKNNFELLTFIKIFGIINMLCKSYRYLFMQV